jgi:hypothetical protein
MGFSCHDFLKEMREAERSMVPSLGQKYRKD